MSPLPLPSHTQIVRTWANEQPSTASEVVSFFEGDPTTHGTMLSTCLTSVAANIPARCIGMTEDEYIRFAVGLTNCHLMKSGKATYDCSDNIPIAKCTNQMSDSVFGVYTTFYTQTLTLCVQLQQDIRNSAAQETLSSLILASDRTTTEIKNLNDRAVEIRTKVDESAAEHARVAQEEMKSLTEISERTSVSIKGMQKLSDMQLTMSNSLHDVATTTDDISVGLSKLTLLQNEVMGTLTHLSQTTANANIQQQELVAQQRVLSIEQEKMHTAHQEIMGSLVFLTKLQTIIFGEFMDLKAVIWYTAMIFVIFALTSCAYTNSARGPLFAGLILTLLIERLLGGYVLVIMPMVRNIFFGYIFGMLIFSFVKYRDRFDVMEQKLDEISHYFRHKEKMKKRNAK